MSRPARESCVGSTPLAPIEPSRIHPILGGVVVALTLKPTFKGAWIISDGTGSDPDVIRTGPVYAPLHKSVRMDVEQFSEILRAEQRRRGGGRRRARGHGTPVKGSPCPARRKTVGCDVLSVRRLRVRRVHSLHRVDLWPFTPAGRHEYVLGTTAFLLASYRMSRNTLGRSGQRPFQPRPKREGQSTE